MIKKIVSMLTEFGRPFAYDHFAEGEYPSPPFLCYQFPNSNNFSGDDGVAHKISDVNIKLYTEFKEPDIENALEDIFDAVPIFYQKTEEWIEEEKLYEIIYSFEIGEE